MGKRELDRLILNTIIDTAIDEVTFVGHGSRDKLIKQCRAIGIKLTCYDYDPKFNDPIDAIFDDVEFADLVVVFNAEKHYPLGKLISKEMIVVGDNDRHNGDCNPVTSCEQLIEQNNLVDVDLKGQVDKWFIVKGFSNAD